MSRVQMIPVGKVHVINPRARSKVKFAEIVNSISKVGVKKPITVCPRAGSGGEYDLVCGQGRLEAVSSLGLAHIPAFVINVAPERRHLMSLVENIARRHADGLALVRGVAELSEKGGYTPQQIAEKIGVTEKYIRSVLRLHAKGEELLLAAVERGDLSIHVAVEIASAKDGDIRKSLAEAYERGDLKGSEVSKARIIVERRLASGRRAYSDRERGPRRPIATDDLVRTYKRATQKQAVLTKRARVCESMLRLVSGALRELVQDEHFVTLLRAEQLDKMPRHLAEQLNRGVAA